MAPANRRAATTSRLAPRRSRDGRARRPAPRASASTTPCRAAACWSPSRTRSSASDSIVRYALNATNSPTVMRPAITSRLPSHSTSSAPRPRKSDMLGKKNPCSRISRRLRSQVLAVRAAEPLHLGRLLPVGAHDADAGQRLLRDGAQLGQLRLDLLEPRVDGAAEVAAPRSTRTAAGSARPASAGGRSTASARSPRRRGSAVLAEYMTAGPIIIRTAFRSLVARDIRSPVRCAWKYDSGSSCRCAKKSFRRSYSMCRETPMMMRRIRNRNDAADRARWPSSAPRVDDELARA